MARWHVLDGGHDWGEGWGTPSNPLVLVRRCSVSLCYGRTIIFGLVNSPAFDPSAPVNKSAGIY